MEKTLILDSVASDENAAYKKEIEHPSSEIIVLAS
jgi:hypothetical protein